MVSASATTSTPPFLACRGVVAERYQPEFFLLIPTDKPPIISGAGARHAGDHGKTLYKADGKGLAVGNILNPRLGFGVPLDKPFNYNERNAACNQRMVTSKTLWASVCVSFISADASIKCPVDEIGKNSLNPSTISSTTSTA